MIGSIVGRVYNSSTYVDGDVVWTSPITEGTVKENEVVSTESGSKYYLSAAPLEDTSKQADIAKVEEAAAASAPAPPAANPQKTTTLRILKEINSAVSELESSLQLLSEGGGSPAPSSSSSSKKAKIDVVLGAQWGDEGKGKLVDMLSQVSRRNFSNRLCSSLRSLPTDPHRRETLCITLQATD